jgi:uncharacterized RDD family membrane protein YckC
MDNPYQAPTSKLELDNATSLELAGRGSRLGAAFLDGLIAFAVIFPLEYAFGFWQLVMATTHQHGQLPIGTMLLWMAIGLVVFIVIQGYPLVTTGQTWGKRMVSIKIVDMAGRKPTVPQLCIRYGIMNLLGPIPYIGKIGVMVDILMIFRGDKRCAHDLAAGTQVVAA